MWNGRQNAATNQGKQDRELVRSNDAESLRWHEATSCVIDVGRWQERNGTECGWRWFGCAHRVCNVDGP